MTLSILISLLKDYWKPLAFLVIMALSWQHGNKAATLACEMKEAKAESAALQAERELNTKVTTKLQKEIAELKKNRTKVREDVYKEVSGDAYACRIPANGVLLLQQAAKPTN